jgi:hypothetical protein
VATTRPLDAGLDGDGDGGVAVGPSGGNRPLTVLTGCVVVVVVGGLVVVVVDGGGVVVVVVVVGEETVTVTLTGAVGVPPPPGGVGQPCTLRVWVPADRGTVRVAMPLTGAPSVSLVPFSDTTTLTTPGPAPQTRVALEPLTLWLLTETA